MNGRPLLAACLLVAACGSLAVALREVRRDEAPAAPASPRRVLPGVQPAGEVLLPNQWSLRPAGKQLELGDFPVNLAVHPGGGYLAVLHAGYGPHEVVLIDLASGKERITCRVPVEQTFTGLTWSPDGKTLFASGGEFEIVHAFAFEEGLLGKPRKIEVGSAKERFIVGGLALDEAGQTLYAAGTWGHAVRIVPLASPAKRRSVALPKDSYPYTCLPAKDGKRLFVSQWATGGIAVIDLAAASVQATWVTERHPTEMVLTPDGKTLYVACANSTRVSVIDTETGKTLETIHCGLYPGSPSGNTPSSLCLTPDGQVLMVANSDSNNLSLFNVSNRGKSRSLGFIPTGWYPTSVRYSAKDKRILVANGKGLTSRANPQGPGPYQRPGLTSLYQYIGGLMKGTLSLIPMPTPDRMAEYTTQAYACSPLQRDSSPRAEGWTAGNPIPRKIGEKSPIKHCIYIIKENRTYDQVFGDIKEGNGDPSLCLFPEKVTPNHHRLVRQFVLLDNFYVEGEVSADGHEWTMGAYATDFVEKVWPLSYRGSPLKKMSFYPSEGAFDYVARPAGGYLWDRAKEAGVSYRSYGEWIANGKKRDDGTFEDSKASVPALEGHFDPKFRGYDLDYLDVKRAARFIEELKRFEKEGSFPQLTILRLPNDHTAGTRVGKPTPTAMVADNDLALGMVVEAISKSKFWKETAIFVVEDDAQNGPDHVDAHRAVGLVVSPYTKHGVVDSTMYSTSSMLRTMELILGLKPMSQFDAAARPMYNAFQAKPDLTPYTSVEPQTDRNAVNQAGVWGAALSEKFDLDKEDAADDLLFNEVIWRSVKGADHPMPAPVRAAFFLSRK
ncbi:MAG: alkaline phosphatase family protein [Gemmataceae bacterium]